MIIYDKYDNIVLDIAVDDSSYRYRELGGDHYVRLEFSATELIDIPLGSYIRIDGIRYTLLEPDNIKMNHTESYDYIAIFDDEQSKLNLYQLVNTVDGRTKFPLTAKPHEHLQLIVDNLTIREGQRWEVEECIDSAEKTLSYNGVSCKKALQLIAAAFETEYEVNRRIRWQNVGGQLKSEEYNAISLHKVEYFKDNPLPLSYGKGKGFKSGVARTTYDESKPLATVFVQGGSRNIDASKYGSSTLLLPKGQHIYYDGSHFEDERGYNPLRGKAYTASDDGYSITTATDNIAEGSVDCSEIYPHREGVVTSVVERNSGEDTPFYDIVDDTIPSTLNYGDYIIPNEDMMVVFQSGMLAGKEFRVKYVHNSIASSSGVLPARRFEIHPQNIDGQTMPGGIFTPAVGDTYAVFGITLPLNYLRDDINKSGASWDMMRKGVKHLAEREKPQYTFTGELDGIWAKEKWDSIHQHIVCGGYIKFDELDADNLLVRIESVKDYITNPHSPEITLSDKGVRGATYRVNSMLTISHIASENQRLDRGNNILRNDISTIGSDRQLYISNIIDIETERDVIDAEYDNFVAIFSRVLDSEERGLIDANGRVLYVRQSDSDYTSYHNAYKEYRQQLQTVTQSNGIADITPSFSRARDDYYASRAVLMKSISNATKDAIPDVDYLKQAFGADSVLDTHAVVLGDLVAVKDEDGDVVAGIYGGANSTLNDSGYTDSEHGTLMMFAGAENAQSASSAKFRAYSDGTIFANSGIFSGVVKHNVVRVSKSNISDIFPMFNEEYRVISPLNMSSIIHFVNTGVLGGDFTGKDSIKFGLSVAGNGQIMAYPGSAVTDIDDLRGLVGTRFIVYNDTDASVSFCGVQYDTTNNEFGSGKCIPIFNGDVGIAECKITLDKNSIEAIYWDIKTGFQKTPLM